MSITVHLLIALKKKEITLGKCIIPKDCLFKVYSKKFARNLYIRVQFRIHMSNTSLKRCIFTIYLT